MSSTDFQIPTNDWNIVGHEHAINTLRRALLAHRVSHAYLFAGPEHIGKTLRPSVLRKRCFVQVVGIRTKRHKIHAIPAFLAAR